MRLVARLSKDAAVTTRARRSSECGPRGAGGEPPLLTPRTSTQIRPRLTWGGAQDRTFATAAIACETLASSTPSVKAPSQGIHAGALDDRSLDIKASAGETRSWPSVTAQDFRGGTLDLYRRRGRKALKKIGHRVGDFSWRLCRKSFSLLKAFLRDPRIAMEWYEDIRDVVVHFVRWAVTGFRLFGSDIRASFFLVKRVVKGYSLTVRQRRLLVRTISDCLKLIPFSFFIIIPFAEALLPLALRLFPNMLPSTFFDKKFDNATLARKLKAKQEIAAFWQQVVEQRTKEISEESDHKHADKAEELRQFQETLMDGKDFPTLKEIFRFNRYFSEELKVKHMSITQLNAMSKMLGLPGASSNWRGWLEVQLRHHIVNLRREDRDYLWEGIDGLTREELIAACGKRCIRVLGLTVAEMRRDLTRWVELSANHRSIPTTLLLWVQSFYLRAPESEEASADKGELQMRVQSAEVEEEAKEAFHSMADRQRAKTENLQHNLEELQHEIEEVVDQAAGRLVETVGVEAGASLRDEMHSLREREVEISAPCEERLQRARVLKRVRELDETAHLYKEVMDMQKSLLDSQLRFLSSMRQNKDTIQRDADVILLDQRVRLMEMIGTFEKDMEAIEEILNNGKPTRTSRASTLF